MPEMNVATSMGPFPDGLSEMYVVNWPWVTVLLAHPNNECASAIKDPAVVSDRDVAMYDSVILVQVVSPVSRETPMELEP